MCQKQGQDSRTLKTKARACTEGGKNGLGIGLAIRCRAWHRAACAAATALLVAACTTAEGLVTRTIREFESQCGPWTEASHEPREGDRQRLIKFIWQAYGWPPETKVDLERFVLTGHDGPGQLLAACILQGYHDTGAYVALSKAAKRRDLIRPTRLWMANAASSCLHLRELFFWTPRGDFNRATYEIGDFKLLAPTEQAIRSNGASRALRQPSLSHCP